MEKVKIFVGGLLSGLVVGAATALLLAPKSGSELREDIRSQGGRALAKTREIGESVKGFVSRKGQGSAEAEDEVVSE